MSDPLILYRAGSLDAATAKELLLERFPGAGVREVCTLDEACEGPLWPERVYVLGLSNPHSDESIVSIDPTPDASVAMQMWAILDFCASTPCQHYPTGCRLCEHRGEYRCAESGKDAAPTWLRYLDDAVTGRWALPDSRAVWAAVEVWDGLPDPMFWRHLVNAEDSRAGLIKTGRAILRARKRWEKEAEETLAVAAVAGSIGADMFGVVRRERDQLRTERDDLRSEVERLGGAVETLTRAGVCLTQDLNETEEEIAKLRAGLREALEEWNGGYCCGEGPHEDDCRYLALCRLAAGYQPDDDTGAA